MASTIPKRTISTYTCIQPAALVLPASVKMLVHSGSFSILTRMSAAEAVSREENDMPRIASINGRASILVMSMC